MSLLTCLTTLLPQDSALLKRSFSPMSWVHRFVCKSHPYEIQRTARHLILHPAFLGGKKRKPVLTNAHVPALSAGQGILPASGTWVNSYRFADDQTIFDQFPDLLTWKKIKENICIQSLKRKETDRKQYKLRENPTSRSFLKDLPS